MPEYTYRCAACGETYDRRHSIKERLTDCEICKVCNSLERIPSIPLILKKIPKGDKIGTPGSVVNEYITDTKEELKKEKEELSKKEY